MTSVFRLRKGAFLRAAVSSLLLFSLTAPAFAASSATVIQLSGSQTSPVSRGDFLKATMNALRFELVHDTKKKPFPHIPPTLLPYVQTADALGALRQFGTTFGSSLPISKGQALQMVMFLEGMQNNTPKDVLFSDVPVGSQLAKAVDIAIDQKWLSPSGNGSFGVAQNLTVGEAQTLIAKIVQTDRSIVVPVLHVGTPTASSGTLPKEQVMKSVWNLVNQDYLYKDRINADQAANDSIQGMLSGLKDPYTVYFPPAKAKNFNDQLQGEITGIGAQVEVQGGLLIIITPLPGSPAEKAGLLPGDVILKADGVDLKDMSIDDSVSHVRGPKGSVATLHIRRNGNEFDVSVLRDSIKTLEIQSSMQSNIAVVKLLQFGTSAENDFRKTITDLMAKNPKGFILDLRNNPGGYLEAADTVTSAFVAQDTPYVSIASKGDTRMEKTSMPQLVPDTIPVIILVNKGSASAAEIVTGALQDAGRARVLGETTFGKGTVQQIWTFDDGSSLKMTIAEWLTPKGRKINGVGLTPDIVMTQSQDRDDVLLRAVSLLQ